MDSRQNGPPGALPPEQPQRSFQHAQRSSPSSQNIRAASLALPTRNRFQPPKTAAEIFEEQKKQLRLRHAANPVPVQLKTTKPWQDWLEMSVRVVNLPLEITTWDLFKRFAREGHIAFIEIFESRNGFRDGNARIRFSQPPVVRPFWDSQVTISMPDGEGEANIQVAVEPQKRSFQIRSPTKPSVWYPEQTSIHPKLIEFGFMYDQSTMKVMHTASRRRIASGFIDKNLTFKVDMLRSKIEIAFPVHFTDPRNQNEVLADKSTPPYSSNNRVDDYMFELPFAQLQSISTSVIDAKHWAITISIDSPPRFFRKLHNLESSHEAKVALWSERDSWYRTADIVYLPSQLKNEKITLNKEKSVIDIGRWTTYHFIFENDQDEMKKWQTLKQIFEDWNIPIIKEEMIRRIAGTRAEFWKLVKPKQDLKLSSTMGPSLPFEIIYQLEVCISQGIFNEHNIGIVFLTKLEELTMQDQMKAQNILEYAAEVGKRIYEPLTLFEDQEALAYNPHSSIPRYCAYTRKATITPTSLYFSTPTVETSNRVIREFKDWNDRFLRVQFTDEKTQGCVNACQKTTDDEIFTRVFRTLLNGIDIGDRHYDFLAFGNSQFRENGAYFFSPGNNMNCEYIRKWMGNFSDIMIPAKYAARLGLCFSTTRAVHHVTPKLIKMQDVERNGHCFTDGVGKISKVLAAVIADQLQLPRDCIPPSAFQFRMGGCKGMLAVWPDVKGYEIHIRPSQQKFSAKYSGLEIISWSRLSTASLNRQTITILSALGVEDEVFNEKLVEQLSNYQKAIEEKQAALDLLTRYIDENQITITIAAMVLNGFMTSKEPFLMSLLHLWRSWSIKLLKEKAKIIVENAAFVFGVTDETGILKGHSHGLESDRNKPRDIESLPQIFLQVSDRTKENHYNVITGICAIGRNPSLHPGDIRVVNAVDVAELHHLRDVVVFSQNGDRDIPSMCSGGDLDGDDFFVLWDEKLIPPVWNTEPMNYTPPKPDEPARPVKITDLMKFFVLYMKNDSLPKIAHAHLAQSDYLDRGIYDEKCLTLAALHSKAVDYVKSGIPATMERHLIPRKWPHFMEKRFKPKDAQYTSHKILGQLYDKVENVNFVPQYEEAFDRRILDAYPKNDTVLMQARKLKSKYDTAMLRIMAQHEIQTEFEVWSTFVLTKPRVGSDYKIQEEMGTISNALKARFRDNVVELAGGKSYALLAPFVAAMYRVTYEEMQIALKECRSTKLLGGVEVPLRKMVPKSMPLMSFPWLFENILGRIATGSQDRSDLESLGINLLPREGIKHSRARSDALEDESEDYIVTETGVIHRGENLDLFQQDEVDSDGEPVQRFDESPAYLNSDEIDIDDGVDVEEETQADVLPRQSLNQGSGHRISSSLNDLAGLEIKSETKTEVPPGQLPTYNSGRLVSSNLHDLAGIEIPPTDPPTELEKLLEDSFDSSAASNVASETYHDAQPHRPELFEVTTVGPPLQPISNESLEPGHPRRGAVVGSMTVAPIAPAVSSREEEDKEEEEEHVLIQPISSAADKLAKMVGL